MTDRMLAALQKLDVRLIDEVQGFEDNFFIGIDEILKNLDWIVPIGMEIRCVRTGRARHPCFPHR